MDRPNVHVLKTLSLPDRFENLKQIIGERVAELLVEPSRETLSSFRLAARSASARREGLFVPVVAASGTGKTTLASSLSGFLPEMYAPTVSYTGQIEYEDLNSVVQRARQGLAADDTRILPINIDHRESAPPEARELATIKRFLRAPSSGSGTILIWPEVDDTTATSIAHAFTKISGDPPIQLPISIQGPDQSTWQEITTHTLLLVNQVPSIEDLGVSPETYDPSQFTTIGAFMRRVSNDFTALVDEMLASTQRPLSLVILYASESYNAGVLSQLTSGTKYGLLDAQALISATPNSTIGRWWASHRGLLTQTILKLNARAFCLPPATAVAILRSHGPQTIASDLESLGVSRPSPHSLHQYISRSDFGKFLVGSSAGAYEARGRPAEDARAAMQVLAERGFTYGGDRNLNEAMLEGMRVFFEKEGLECPASGSERQLDFCPLIPDNFVDRREYILCVEYTWRAGDFLGSSHRSEVAQYALRKLKNYAVALGWAHD